jgi:hypothetical protein
MQLFTSIKVTLASGKRISCDFYLPAIAKRGNATFLPPTSLDNRGYVKVDDYLKVMVISFVT